MPVKPLSDRILDALPSLDAPTVSQMAAYINFDMPRVRAAYDALETAGQAKIVRRGVGLHLLPVDYPGRICPVCRAEYKGHGKTCSKSCGMRVAWTKRDRAKQGDVMRRARVKGEAAMQANNIASHRTPEYRARHAERNRKEWADPVMRMKRVVGMESAWQGPQAEPRKAKARAMRIAQWADPEWKAKAVEAMRTGQRGRHQRAVLQMVSEGAEAEEIAASTGRTLEQTRLLWRRLYRLGKVDRAPVDGRKTRPVRPKRSVVATGASA